MGGASGVIDAIRQVIGELGTVTMVLGAQNDWAWVNDRPEGERTDLLADAEPFDARMTPADPDVGVLAEVLRKHPGAFVSDHPEGRFAALGMRARALVEDVPWNDYFGPGSPLERLLDAGGKVLRIGADHDTTTLLHHAEYQANVPDKRRVRRHRLVATPSGPRVSVVESLDDEEGIVDFDGDDYFAVILTEYLAEGRASTGQVGDTVAELIDGAELVEFAVRWMENHFG